LDGLANFLPTIELKKEGKGKVKGKRGRQKAWCLVACSADEADRSAVTIGGVVFG
jgi:hypothetical protein